METQRNTPQNAPQNTPSDTQIGVVPTTSECIGNTAVSAVGTPVNWAGGLMEGEE